MPRLKAPPLLRQAVVYGVSQLGVKAIPFLLLPVMTRYMSPADYGIVTMLLLVSAFLEPIIGLGLSGAVTVKYYDKTVDLARYVATGLALVVGAALVVLVILIPSSGLLGDVTGVPAAWLLLVVPLVFGRVTSAVLLALLRVREKAVHFATYVNLQSLFVIGLALLLVVGLGLTWRGRIAAEIIGAIGFGIVALASVNRSGLLAHRVDTIDIRDILAFGVPLIPHSLAGVLMVQTDRIMLTNLIGVSETGLYAVGYQLAVVIELAAVAFNNAYAPWLFRNLSEASDTARRRLVRLTYAQFTIMAALAGAVAIAMPWVASELLGNDFARSGGFVGWFALAFMFSGMYYMVTNYIFFAQRTRWLAAVTVTVALLNVPLTYILINASGSIGAAQALAVTFGLMFALTWLVSSRVYPMPWFGRGSATA